jgi:hypothetical protein
MLQTVTSCYIIVVIAVDAPALFGVRAFMIGLTETVRVTKYESAVNVSQ